MLVNFPSTQVTLAVPLDVCVSVLHVNVNSSLWIYFGLLGENIAPSIVDGLLHSAKF